MRGKGSFEYSGTDTKELKAIGKKLNSPARSKDLLLKTLKVI